MLLLTSAFYNFWNALKPVVVIWCGGSLDEEREGTKGDVSFYRVRFARPPGLSPTTVKWAVTTPSTGLRVIR